MSAPPLVRLPDPVGEPLGNGSENAWTLGFAIDPTGTAVAQVYATLSGLYAGKPFALAVYTRTGDQWTRQTVPMDVAQCSPVNVAWSPDGQWLAVTAGYGIYNVNLRVWVYHRQGDSISAPIPAPAEVTTSGLGFGTDQAIGFSCDGRQLVCADAYGNFSGIVSFDPDTGAMAVTDHLTGMVAIGATWHPTDPTLFAALDPYGQATVYRTVNGLSTPVAFLGGQHSGLVWHPSGNLLIGNDYVACGLYAPVVYTWPANTWIGAMTAFGGYITGLSFSRDGAYVSAGFLTGPDTDFSGSIADTYHPLTLAAFQDNETPSFEYAGYQVFDPLPVGDTIAGNITSWGAADGAQYLAACAWPGFGPNIDLADADLWGSVWGWRSYRIGTAAPAHTTRLQVRQPDGSFAARGASTGAPIAQRLAGGGLRTWPGAQAPLWQKMPDGTWQKVIV